MRISRLLACLCLLALLCACAAPEAALPETPAESTAAPEPVPTEPPVPAEPVEVPVAAEEPEPEYALLPAEPVWLLGRLTDVYSTRESEWIRAEDVPEDAPMQTLNEVFTGEETLWAAVADILESAAPLQPEPGILDDLESISFGGQDYVKLEDAAARLGLEWGLAPDGSRYLAKRQTVGEIPEGWNVPVLMYHAVGDEIWGYSDLFVSAASMEEQLQYLQENGYEAIWFSDLAHIEDYEKPVILTFDDGYDDNYTVLYPLLEKYQTKATIFVIETSPANGEPLTSGQTVTLVVSLGPDIELVEVPTLVGEDVDEALALIAKAGLQNGSIRNDDSDLPKGTVTFQSIDGGQMVKKDTVINLRVSSGPQEAATPVVTNLSQDQAVLQDESLTLSISAYASDDGTLRYAWYMSRDGSYDNAALVSRSKEGNTTCEADTSVPGTYYYFCIVENSLDDNTKTTKSNMIEVVVQEKAVEKTIDVTLPSKNGLYEVTVYVDGTLQYGPTSVSITDGTAVMLQIPVRGKGTLPVDVYLDGAIYDSQLISFG